MPTLNSQLRQRVSHAVCKNFEFNSSDEARTKPFENMEENILTNISSGRLELGMERWVGFISWEDQGYSLLGEEAWCAKVRMCLWGRVSGPGYDGSSLCCLIIDSWCDDLSVTPTMFPACFSWREGWTAIPTKAFTQVLLVWSHLQCPPWSLGRREPRQLVIARGFPALCLVGFVFQRHLGNMVWVA